MRKYWAVFRLSFARIMAYRFNFLLGRLRNVVVMLLLFYVWRSLTLKTGSFAGYTEAELVAYVFGINILRSVIFGAQSRDVAHEINQGYFSKYLAQPVNYFWFNWFRELAQRSVNTLAAVVEVSLFVLILRVDIFTQSSRLLLAACLLSIILAALLYSVISYAVSLLAFWSREAMGPRFLFEWILESASGAYFPLNILSPFWFAVLSRLPFFYLLYLPISIYLGRYGWPQIMLGLTWQLFWLVGFSLLTKVIWDKGLERYSGEGA